MNEDKPHYTLPSSELAAWIEQQGLDQWWNVDGDPLLTSHLAFPCPGDELAAELYQINRPLVVFDPRKDHAAQGQSIDRSALDRLAARLGDNVQLTCEKPSWTNDRLFFLRWKDADEEWLLVEDDETSESSQADAAALQRKN